MRWEATAFWSIASPWTPPWTPCKKEAGFGRSKQSPEHHQLTEHMLNSTSFPLKDGHFQDQFFGFPDLTGGRWYQVLDLFAQDLRRTDVVTFNCAVASCEAIRFTLGGSFLWWEQRVGSTAFFFFSDFGDAWVFHGSLAWVWLVHHRKVGNCPYPEFPRYFWRNHGRLRGDLCCVATLLRRSFQGGQLRWSYCCCVQRTEG